MPFVDFKVVVAVCFCLFPLQISFYSEAYDNNVPLEILDRMMIYLKGHFNKAFRVSSHSNMPVMKDLKCGFI